MSNENEIIEMLELDDPLMFLPTTIRIKRGDGVPTTVDLQDGELGFSRARKTLYIKDETYTGTKVPQEHRLEGKDYSGIIPIGTVTGGGSGGSVEIELDTTVSQPGMAADAASVRALIEGLVGNLEELQTEDKTNLVFAINEALGSISEGADIELDTEITAESAGKAADAAAVRREIDESIEEAFNKFKEEQDYEKNPLKINSFSITPTTVERGTAISSVKLTWKLSRTPTILTIDGMELSNTSTGATLTANPEEYSNGIFPTGKEWTLYAEDEKKKVSDKRKISYALPYFCGCAVAPKEYNTAFIRSLGSDGQKSLSFIKQFNYDAGGEDSGKYVYYCCPANSGSYSFTEGPLPFGMVPNPILVDFEDLSMNIVKYWVFQSGYSGIGKGTITVAR